MKNILTHINKTFDHRIRLGIMSALSVHESITFNELKELLGATDGNLASHIKSLEKVSYILVRKQFIERKPNTSYAITTEGTVAFRKHIIALEKLIKLK